LKTPSLGEKTWIKKRSIRKRYKSIQLPTVRRKEIIRRGGGERGEREVKENKKGMGSERFYNAREMSS